jgi:hypothetical protein
LKYSHRSILVALVDEVLDALARTEGEVVLLPKSKHAGHSSPPPFPLFFGEGVPCAGSRLQRPYHDFLGRTAHTASERGFEQLLPMGCELDRHRYQYNLGDAAAGPRSISGSPRAHHCFQ